jgi:hypothetical protein
MDDLLIVIIRLMTFFIETEFVVIKQVVFVTSFMEDPFIVKSQFSVLIVIKQAIILLRVLEKYLDP